MTTQSSNAPHKYLVAWGGDKPSADALALGAVLAATFKAELHAVYVQEEESMPSVQYTMADSFRRKVGETVRQQFDEAASDLPDDIKVELHVRTSPSVATAILEEAKEIGADCIVIGAGSRGGVLTNPIASSLLHASPVPVAMAPKGFRFREFAKLDELVVAVGTRPGAQVVVEEGVEAVSRVGLPLRLWSFVESDAQDTRVSEARIAEAEKQLAAAKDAVEGRCEVSTELSEGKSLKAAVDAKEWEWHSALMIGSSRLAPGRQTFLGRTAARLVSLLPVPIIVVPRSERTNTGR